MIHAKPRYRLGEGLVLLGLSRAKGYQRVKEGRLNVTYDGGTPFLTAAEIDRYAAASQPKTDYSKTAAAARAGARAP